MVEISQANTSSSHQRKPLCGFAQEKDTRKGGAEYPTEETAILTGIIGRIERDV
jgi:hypothetical protein